MTEEKLEQYRRRRRRSSYRRALLLALTVALLVGAAVGGSLAWLTAQTEKVVNVFTTSNVEVELTETTEEFKMIPGCTIEKDPVVTIKAGSEDCWAFIKVEENGVSVTSEGNMPSVYTFDDFISYAIDKNNWTPLTDTDEDGYADDGVYYCEVTDVSQDRLIKVLGYYDGSEFVNNQVLVKDTVTKEMMDDVEAAMEANTDNQPRLSFTAYAVQLWKNNTTKFTPQEAWDEINPGSAAE